MKRKPSKPTPKGTGKGGTPPAENRFKPGPDPRRGKGQTAGAILKNCINGFYRRNVRDTTLRKIIANKRKPSHVRQAAEIILHTRHATTLADFQSFIDGTKTLAQLAAEGVDISVVKRVKIGKSRQYEDEDGNDVFEQGERSIELHDHVGLNFDRIVEHTDGRPKQTTELKIDALLPTPADRDLAATEASSRLRKIFSSNAN